VFGGEIFGAPLGAPEEEAQQSPSVKRNVGAIGAAPIGRYAIGQASITEGGGANATANASGVVLLVSKPVASLVANSIAHTQGQLQFIVSAPTARASERSFAKPVPNEAYADLDYVVPDYIDDALQIISVSSPIGVFQENATISVSDLSEVVATVFSGGLSASAIIAISDLPQVNVLSAIAGFQGDVRPTPSIPSVTLTPAEATASGQAEATYGALLVSATAPVVTTGIVEDRTVNVSTGTRYINSGYLTEGYFQQQAGVITASSPSPTLTSSISAQADAPQISVVAPLSEGISSLVVSVDHQQVVITAPEASETITESPLTLPTVVVSKPAVNATGGQGANAFSTGTEIYVEEDYVDLGYVEESIPVNVITASSIVRLPQSASTASNTINVSAPQGFAGVSVTAQPSSLIQLSVIPPQPFEIVGEFPLQLNSVIVSAPIVDGSGAGSAQGAIGTAVISAPEASVTAIVSPDTEVSDLPQINISAATSEINAGVTLGVSGPLVNVLPASPSVLRGSLVTVNAPSVSVSASASSVGIVENRTVQASTGQNYISSGYHETGYFKQEAATIIASSPESSGIANLITQVDLQAVNVSAAVAQVNLNTEVSLAPVAISVTAPAVNEIIKEIPLTLSPVNVSAPVINVVGGTSGNASPLGVDLYVDSDYVDSGYIEEALPLSIIPPIAIATLPFTQSVDSNTIVVSGPDSEATVSRTIQPASLIPVSIVSPQPFEIVGEFPLQLNPVVVSPALSAGSGGGVVNTSSNTVSLTAAIATASGTANINVDISPVIISAPQTKEAVSEFPEDLPAVIIAPAQAIAVVSVVVEVVASQIDVSAPLPVITARTTTEVDFALVSASSAEVTASAESLANSDGPTVVVTAPSAIAEITENRVAKAPTGKNYISAGYHATGYFAEESATVSIATLEIEAVIAGLATSSVGTLQILPAESNAQGSSSASVSVGEIRVSAPDPYEVVGEFPLSLPQVNVNAPIVSVTNGTGVTVNVLGSDIYVDPDYVDVGYTEDSLLITVSSAISQVTKSGSVLNQVESNPVIVNAPIVEASVNVSASAVVNTVAVDAALADPISGALIQPASLIAVTVSSPQSLGIVNESPGALNPVIVTTPIVEAFGGAVGAVDLAEIAINDAQGFAKGVANISTDISVVGVTAPVVTAFSVSPANVNDLPQVTIGTPEAVSFEFYIEDISIERKVNVEKEHRLTFVPAENRATEIQTEIRITDVFPKGDR